MHGELCTVFVSKQPCMANFVPLSPPTSHAWRTLYRMRGRDGASHHSTPGTAGVEGAGGTGGHKRVRLRCPRAVAGPGRGAGGWRRGLAGLRADAPSEARGADGERAGRPRGGRRSVGATSNKAPPVWRARAAGPSGARNTRGATSSPARQGTQTTTSGTGRRHDPRLGRQGTQS